jgi:hypothetical protein
MINQSYMDYLKGRQSHGRNVIDTGNRYGDGSCVYDLNNLFTLSLFNPVMVAIFLIDKLVFSLNSLISLSVI